MTPLLFVLVAAAGGVGAAARLLMDGLIRAWIGDRLPWGTIAINLSGSLLLGLFVGLTATAAPPWSIVAGTGFLGGYTTFSTASIETVRLLQRRRVAAALLAGPLQLALATALAVAGLLIGRAL